MTFILNNKKDMVFKQYKQTLSALSIPLWRSNSILNLWLEQRNLANAFLNENGMSIYINTFQHLTMTWILYRYHTGKTQLYLRATAVPCNLLIVAYTVIWTYQYLPHLEQSRYTQTHKRIISYELLKTNFVCLLHLMLSAFKAILWISIILHVYKVLV